MIDGMTTNGGGRARLPLTVRPGLDLELASPAVAAEYYALVERNLERLARWEPWAGAPQSLTGVRLYLAWQAQAYTSGSQLVGSCSARIDATDGTAEIGYWIDGEQEGRGVASAGVAALVGMLLDRGDIGRVQARAAAGNARSRALLERLGFSFEGVLRSSQRIAGGRQDMAMYAVLSPAGD
jgi:ribosomal-protein-serine acetyltransferase